jgi:hypothetical protein
MHSCQFPFLSLLPLFCRILAKVVAFWPNLALEIVFLNFECHGVSRFEKGGGAEPKMETGSCALLNYHHPSLVING